MSNTFRPVAEATTLHYPTDETWQGFVGVHGGVLVAALLTAATELVPGAPATVTAHFMTPVPPGEVDVEAEILHPGRTAAVSARIGSSVSALIRIARDAAGSSLTWPQAPADDAPPPDALAAMELPVEFVPMGRYLEIRPISASRPLSGGDDPSFDVWIRMLPLAFAHRAFTTPEVAAIMLDMLPPGLFATLDAPVPIPTAELTAHFTPVGAVAQDWFRLRHRTAWATDTLCVDETDLLRRDGVLVAQARQLRRIIRPR